MRPRNFVDFSGKRPCRHVLSHFSCKRPWILKESLVARQQTASSARSSVRSDDEAHNHDLVVESNQDATSDVINRDATADVMPDATTRREDHNLSEHSDDERDVEQVYSQP